MSTTEKQNINLYRKNGYQKVGKNIQRDKYNQCVGDILKGKKFKNRKKQVEAFRKAVKECKS